MSQLNNKEILEARIYYLCCILHDWPNETCTSILANIVVPMAPDPMIMIDEVVVPELNVPWLAAFVEREYNDDIWGKITESR